MSVIEQPRQWEGLTLLGGFWALYKKIIFCYLERCWAIILYLELCWNILLCGIIFSYFELLSVRLIYLELSWIMGRYLALSWVTFVDLVLFRVYSVKSWVTVSFLKLCRDTSCYLELLRGILSRLESSSSIASILELSWVIWNYYWVVLWFFSVPPATCLENKLGLNFSHIISITLFAPIT